MLKPNSAILLATTFAVALSASAARAADVGLIASVMGNVQVARAPGAKMGKASVMQTLADGSSVKVAPGGKAIVILFQGGTRYELASGSVTTLTPTACRSVSGPAPKALAALQIRQAKLLEGSRVASGRAASTVLRGESGHIILQSLSATSILDAHPVFQWSAIPGATSYKVRLWDEDDQIVWQKESQTLSLAYPADAPALKPDADYLWRVTTTVGDTSYKGEGIFKVLDTDKSSAVKAELDGLDKSQDEAVLGVLRAEIYTRNELWDDAISTYQQLVTQFPDSDSIRDALDELLTGQSRAEKSLAPKTPVPGIAPTI